MRKKKQKTVKSANDHTKLAHLSLWFCPAVRRLNCSQHQAVHEQMKPFKPLYDK